MAEHALKIPKGLVVSCQALENEPLHGSQLMVRMAKAALEGGAVGIRANGVEDIMLIKQEVELPIIGLLKRVIQGSDVYITPTWDDVLKVHEAGADIVALDATGRVRPGGLSLRELLIAAKEKGISVMADISTFEEGVQAAKWGADYLSTTLSGYTSYSRTELPNLALVEQLAQELQVPVAAEGGICLPEQATEALERGASFVVVGSAITRPQWITRRYVEAMESSNSIRTSSNTERSVRP